MKRIILSLILAIAFYSVSFGAPANTVSVSSDEKGFLQATAISALAPANTFPSEGSANIQWNSTAKLQYLNVKSIAIVNSSGSDGAIDYYMTYRVTGGMPETAFPSQGTSSTPISVSVGAVSYISFSDAIVEVNLYFKNGVADDTNSISVYIAGRR